jgi:glycosyltransferase involved in cell wall biosynthesis
MSPGSSGPNRKNKHRLVGGSETVRICMMSYSFYEIDNRIRRYAETLARRGDHVDVISLAQEGDPAEGSFGGVNVYRIQKRIINERSKFTYLGRLLKFFILSAYRISRMHLRQRYDVVHVHNIPDFEVFAALIPKITGTPVILDIHDILPEFYADKFHVGKDNILFRIMLFVEKISTAFSDHVIISNHIWQERLTGRSVSNGKCSVIMNYPDPEVFYPRNVEKAPGKFVLIYPGTVNRHQGLDIAIKAFARIKDEIPEVEFYIYGDGQERPALEKLISGLGLENRVYFRGRVSIEKVVEEMAKADVGLVPKRDEGFGGEAFSTKTWEFMRLDVPIILSRTRIDDYYFNDEVVRFFDPGDEESLARSIVAMRKDEGARAELVRNAREYMKDKGWEVKKAEYLDLVDGLARRANARHA